MAKLPQAAAGARLLGSRMVAVHKQANPDGRMPILDHLRELRSRVVKAALAIVVATAVGLLPWVFDRVWAFMEHPYCQAIIHGVRNCKRDQTQGNLIVTGIFDPFTVRIEVAFFFALIVTSPIWLYQLWAFIAPGL